MFLFNSAAIPFAGNPRRKPVTDKPEKSERPAYDAFAIDGDGRDAFWMKVGGAWWHEDRKGLNVQISALPVNGRLVLREPKEREERQAAKAEPKSRDKKQGGAT